jgi:hypothetical protein
MVEAFDPYCKWLGIPPEEQPPTHYHMLGIPAFEGDVDIIRAAVEQRVLFLRTLQLSPQVKLAERLLNEVIAPPICLLDQEKKARSFLRASDGRCGWDRGCDGV